MIECAMCNRRIYYHDRRYSMFNTLPEIHDGPYIYFCKHCGERLMERSRSSI